MHRRCSLWLLCRVKSYERLSGLDFLGKREMLDGLTGTYLKYSYGVPAS